MVFSCRWQRPCSLDLITCVSFCGNTHCSRSCLTATLQYGLGTPAPIASLGNVFDPSLPLIWADGTNTTTTHPNPTDVMQIVIQSLRPEHRSAVRQVSSPDQIYPACPQNFNRFSECFAAVSFTNFPTPANPITSTPPSPRQQVVGVGAPITFSPPNGTAVLNPNSLLNYTIHVDAGLGFIDVVNHASDYEKRVLPLQWAIDSVSLTVHFRKRRHAPAAQNYVVVPMTQTLYSAALNLEADKFHN